MIFIQIYRFIFAGIINTIVDLTVYNLLMFLTGITSGIGLAILTSISFLIANINSYYLNKNWTFGSKEKNAKSKGFLAFFSASIVGFFINVSIVYILTTYVDDFFGISYINNLDIILEHGSDIWWANFAKIFATAISMVFNFIAYKFFIFSKNK